MPLLGGGFSLPVVDLLRIFVGNIWGKRKTSQICSHDATLGATEGGESLHICTSKLKLIYYTFFVLLGNGEMWGSLSQVQLTTARVVPGSIYNKGGFPGCWLRQSQCIGEF